jgi:DNA-binding GntR family transcriptional regulator
MITLPFDITKISDEELALLEKTLREETTRLDKETAEAVHNANRKWYQAFLEMQKRDHYKEILSRKETH